MDRNELLSTINALNRAIDEKQKQFNTIQYHEVYSDEKSTIINDLLHFYHVRKYFAAQLNAGKEDTKDE